MGFEDKVYMSLGEAAIFEYAFKLGMQIAIETLTEYQLIPRMAQNKLSSPSLFVKLKAYHQEQLSTKVQQSSQKYIKITKIP
ncbi:MAG: hypothetical protein IJX06_01710 [Clostridia bacterium]|nr:hypothetical protein [Clostridia bacterium]